MPCGCGGMFVLLRPHSVYAVGGRSFGKKSGGGLFYKSGLQKPSPGRGVESYFMEGRQPLDSAACENGMNVGRSRLFPVSVSYPNLLMRRNLSSSRMVIFLPSTTKMCSAAKAVRVRMAFEVVMFERLARSSRER